MAAAVRYPTATSRHLWVRLGLFVCVAIWGSIAINAWTNPGIEQPKPPAKISIHQINDLMGRRSDSAFLGGGVLSAERTDYWFDENKKPKLVIDFKLKVVARGTNSAVSDWFVSRVIFGDPAIFKR